MGRLKRLYRKRERRFGYNVKRVVADFVKRCWENGVSEVVVGDIKHLVENANYPRKVNSMIHGF